MKTNNHIQSAVAKLDLQAAKLGEKLWLPQSGSWPGAFHVFDNKSLWALKAAIAAERPLLIRGEPGTGKSQLARAAAVVLGRVFIPEVVHSRSECHELQYHYDAVSRLGEAQALSATASRYNNEEDILEKLNPERYIAPGVLWWAFDWDDARVRHEKSRFGGTEPCIMENCSPDNGSVVLIDEIDKADVDLPNGLLETLGNGAFSVPYLQKSIGLKQESPPPLVIITTNEERELPAAFVRRCLVLHLDLPKDKDGDDGLLSWLVKRGTIHFDDNVKPSVMAEAARQLYEDRQNAERQNQPKPGQAEYLDMLRAIQCIGSGEQEQLKVLGEIKDFALKKSSSAWSR